MILTDDLEIVSKTTRIRARGKIDAVANRSEFDVTANFRGPVGLATSIVAKILEIRGEGPVNNMEYRLRNVPRILPENRPRLVPRIIGRDKPAPNERKP